VRSKIPWQELPLSAEECGQLWGISGDHFLRTYACLQTFPIRIHKKPAAWKAGEVITWRDSNRSATGG
jgi:predicted DNA-binding transcriptional regulator AlpA